MDLQRARDWADLALKALSVVALLMAGIWTYHQFKVTDPAPSNIQLAMTIEVVTYTDDLRILVVHAKPKNAGKVLVNPGMDGFVITVYAIPQGLKPGRLDLDAFPEVHRVDLMKRFPEGYDIEPGLEYDEIEALVVPKGSLYVVRAVLDLGDYDQVDHTAIVRVD